MRLPVFYAMTQICFRVGIDSKLLLIKGKLTHLTQLSYDWHRMHRMGMLMFAIQIYGKKPSNVS